jgi:molybdopterin-guanine dinucleotide biosynthesis protein A
VFYSCRRDQDGDPILADRKRIVDAVPDRGPLEGILSAFRGNPAAAFLVAACDLPFLDGEAVRHLFLQRDPTRPATAFFNAERGKPEPLFAIYEPAYAALASAWAAQGLSCPTKILERTNARLIRPPDGRFLANANHPKEYSDAVIALSGEDSRG